MATKRGFNEVIREINFRYTCLILLTTLARSSLIFLISYLLVASIGLAWWLSLIPFVICFVILYHIEARESPYEILEDKYPKIKDKLTTAHDNSDADNEIVTSLHKEVRLSLSKIKVSSLIDTQRLKKDLILVALLSLIIVLISPFNPILINMDLKFSSLDLETLDPADEPRSIAGGASNKDIFGDKNIALLGNQDLEISFAYGDDSLDISKINKPKKLEFKASYPEDIGAVASSSFEEEVPEEQQELIKAYYKKITEG